MANYTDVASGGELLPFLQRVATPTLINGVTASQVFQTWQTELSATTVDNSRLPDATERGNNRGTRDFLASNARMFETGNVSSNIISWSGRFQLNLYYLQAPTTRGSTSTSLAGVDFSSTIGGDPWVIFRAARFQLPALSILIGTRSTEYFIVGEPQYNFANAFYHVANFTIGTSTSADPAANIVIKFRTYDSNNMGPTSPIANNSPGAIEIFIENLTIPNCEIIACTFNQNLTQGGVTSFVVPGEVTAFDVPVGGNYFALSDEVQDTRTISGTVQEGSDNFLARDVLLYDSTNNRLAAQTTSSATDGSFSFDVQPNREFFAVCRDPTEGGRNALIFDGIVGA